MACLSVFIMNSEPKQLDDVADHFVNALFPQVIEKQYCIKYVTSAARTKVKDLINEVVNGFTNVLQNNDWLTSATKQKALETPIEDLDFSVRAYNCLKREGVSTLQDLVNMSASEVSKIHNLGKKSLDEVLLKIKELGLVLKEED